MTPTKEYQSAKETGTIMAMHDTWPNANTDSIRHMLHDPVNWELACARANLRMGVPLTEAQRKLIEEARDERV